MKRKIKVVDNISHKTIEGTVNTRNLLHFEVQKRTRSTTFEDRRFKKPKHKSKTYDLD